MEHERPERPTDTLLPFAYQSELISHAKKQNSIIYLETGQGKTLVAALILLHRLQLEYQYAKTPLSLPIHPHLPPKLIYTTFRHAIFIVPTNALAVQQIKTLKEQAGIVAFRVVGENLSKLITKFKNNAVSLQQYLLSHQALVVTDGAFLEMLKAGFVSIESISSIVFDEAHNARGNHPYTHVLRFYHRSKQILQTHLFAFLKVAMQHYLHVRKFTYLLCELCGYFSASVPQHEQNMFQDVFSIAQHWCHVDSNGRHQIYPSTSPVLLSRLARQLYLLLDQNIGGDQSHPLHAVYYSLYEFTLLVEESSNQLDSTVKNFISIYRKPQLPWYGIVPELCLPDMLDNLQRSIPPTQDQLQFYFFHLVVSLIFDSSLIIKEYRQLYEQNVEIYAPESFQDCFLKFHTIGNCISDLYLKLIDNNTSSNPNPEWEQLQRHVLPKLRHVYQRFLPHIVGLTASPVNFALSTQKAPLGEAINVQTSEDGNELELERIHEQKKPIENVDGQDCTILNASSGSQKLLGVSIDKLHRQLHDIQTVYDSRLISVDWANYKTDTQNLHLGSQNSPNHDQNAPNHHHDIVHFGSMCAEAVVNYIHTATLTYGHGDGIEEQKFIDPMENFLHSCKGGSNNDRFEFPHQLSASGFNLNKSPKEKEGLIQHKSSYPSQINPQLHKFQQLVRLLTLNVRVWFKELQMYFESIFHVSTFLLYHTTRQYISDILARNEYNPPIDTDLIHGSLYNVLLLHLPFFDHGLQHQLRRLRRVSPMYPHDIHDFSSTDRSPLKIVDLSPATFSPDHRFRHELTRDLGYFLASHPSFESNGDEIYYECIQPIYDTIRSHNEFQRTYYFNSERFNQTHNFLSSLPHHEHFFNHVDKPQTRFYDNCSDYVTPILTQSTPVQTRCGPKKYQSASSLQEDQTHIISPDFSIVKFLRHHNYITGEFVICDSDGVSDTEPKPFPKPGSTIFSFYDRTWKSLPEAEGPQVNHSLISDLNTRHLEDKIDAMCKLVYFNQSTRNSLLAVRPIPKPQHSNTIHYSIPFIIPKVPIHPQGVIFTRSREDCIALTRNLKQLRCEKHDTFCEKTDIDGPLQLDCDMCVLLTQIKPAYLLGVSGSKDFSLTKFLIKHDIESDPDYLSSDLSDDTSFDDISHGEADKDVDTNSIDDENSQINTSFQSPIQPSSVCVGDDDDHDHDNDHRNTNRNNNDFHNPYFSPNNPTVCSSRVPLDQPIIASHATHAYLPFVVINPPAPLPPVQLDPLKQSYLHNLPWYLGGNTHPDAPFPFPAFAQKHANTVLKSFGSNVVNLLIATTVAEEGIDISHCTYIVLYNSVDTFQQYIQRRGRARHSHARLFIFEGLHAKLRIPTGPPPLQPNPNQNQRRQLSYVVNGILAKGRGSVQNVNDYREAVMIMLPTSFNQDLPLLTDLHETSNHSDDHPSEINHILREETPNDMAHLSPSTALFGTKSAITEKLWYQFSPLKEIHYPTIIKKSDLLLNDHSSSPKSLFPTRIEIEFRETMLIEQLRHLHTQMKRFLLEISNCGGFVATICDFDPALDDKRRTELAHEDSGLDNSDDDNDESDIGNTYSDQYPTLEAVDDLLLWCLPHKFPQITVNSNTSLDGLQNNPTFDSCDGGDNNARYNNHPLFAEYNELPTLERPSHSLINSRRLFLPYYEDSFPTETLLLKVKPNFSHLAQANEQQSKLVIDFISALTSTDFASYSSSFFPGWNFSNLTKKQNQQTDTAAKEIIRAISPELLIREGLSADSILRAVEDVKQYYSHPVISSIANSKPPPKEAKEILASALKLIKLPPTKTHNSPFLLWIRNSTVQIADSLALSIVNQWYTATLVHLNKLKTNILNKNIATSNLPSNNPHCSLMQCGILIKNLIISESIPQTFQNDIAVLRGCLNPQQASSGVFDYFIFLLHLSYHSHHSPLIKQVITANPVDLPKLPGVALQWTENEHTTSSQLVQHLKLEKAIFSTSLTIPIFENIFPQVYEPQNGFFYDITNQELIPPPLPLQPVIFGYYSTSKQSAKSYNALFLLRILIQYKLIQSSNKPWSDTDLKFF